MPSKNTAWGCQGRETCVSRYCNSPSPSNSQSLLTLSGSLCVLGWNRPQPLLWVFRFQTSRGTWRSSDEHRRNLRLEPNPDPRHKHSNCEFDTTIKGISCNPKNSHLTVNSLGRCCLKIMFDLTGGCFLGCYQNFNLIILYGSGFEITCLVYMTVMLHPQKLSPHFAADTRLENMQP